MADPKIKIRRSATPNKVPTKDQLQLGELAINTYDGKLYLEQDQGGVGVGNTVIAVNPWGVGIGSTAYNTHFTSGKVGVGTTNAQYNLDVGGDINFTGNLYQDGSAFTSGVGIKTSGGVVGYGATIIDFRGPGVTTAYYSSATGIGTVYFQGGGGGGGNASVTVSDSAPSSPSNGDLWFKSDVGELYLWYTDGSSNQWVEASGGSNTVITSDTAPSSPQDGDLWWNSDTGELKVYYNDGNSSQWVDANSEGGFVQYFTQTNTNGTLGVTTTGYVGIGTTTATDALTVSGNVNVTGVSTFQGNVNVTGVSTFQNHVHLLDNDRLRLGGSAGTFDGLDIYHDGNSSYVDDSGSGNLQLRGNDRVILAKYTGENMVRAMADGSVDLFYDNSLKFQTTNTGASVTGDLAASGNVTGVAATFTGNVTVGGVLTYEDVKNVDAIGVVTARTGIKVLAGGANIVDGTTTDELNVTGVATAVQVNATTLNVSGVSTFAGHVGTSATVGIGSTAYAHKFALLDAGTNGGKDAAAIGSSGKNLRFWGTGGSAGIWGSTGLKIAGNGATADTPVDTNVHLHLLSGQNTKFKMEASGYSSLELVANQGGSGVQNHIQSNKPILFFTGPSSGLTTAFRIGEDEGSTFYHPLEFRHPYATYPGGTRTIVMEPVSGIITATKFKGDGSELTGVISGIGIGTEGGVVGYAATIVHFKGAGVTTAYYSSATGIGTINFHSATTGGGGANVTVSDTPPGSPSAGDLWWESDIGELKIYYSDGDSAQWVDASGADSLVQIGTSAPTGAVSGDLWFNSETGDFMVYYTDANSSAWVSVNAVNSNTKWITNATGIHTTGNVGIGTTTATDPLTVVGAADIDGRLIVSGITTFGSHVYHGDNDRDIYGDGSDLQIFHNALDSHIDNNTGNLVLRTNVTSDVGGNIKLMPKSNENGIIITHDASVELYENNVKRLETTSTGVSITGNNVVSGNLTAVDGTLSGDLDVDGHTNLDNVSIAGVTTFANTARFSGDVNIVGTLTYEDVKNVDSIGIVTARGGLNVTANTDTDTLNVSGISTLGSPSANNTTFINSSTAANSEATTLVVGHGSGNYAGMTFQCAANYPGAVYFTDTDTGKQGGMAYYHIGDELRLYAGETQKMALNSDGTTINNGSLFVADKITHNGDTNTHIRFPAADTITAETGGSERLRIDSSGKLGIGVNNPAYFISIENATPYIRVKDTAAPTDEKTWDFNAGTDGILRFRNTNDAANSSNNWLEVERDGVATSSIRLLTGSGSERLRITSGGQVNIGGNYTQTTDTFQVNGTIRGSNLKATAAFYADGNANTALHLHSTGTTGQSRIFLGDASTFQAGKIVYDHTNDYMMFGTGGAGAERLRIDSSGDVSIGSATNSGSNRLQIVDSHTEAYVNSTDSIFRIINENTSADTNQASISFTCSTTGSGADSAIVSQAENSSGNSNLQFWTDTSNGMSEKLRITSDGKVGITSTAPTGALDVRTGTHGFDGFIKLTKDNNFNPSIEYYRTTGSGPNWYGAQLRLMTGDFTYSYAGSATLGNHSYSEIVRITQHGKVGIGIDNPAGILEVQKNGVPAIIANYNNQKHLQMGAGGSGAGFHLTDGNFFTINHQPYANRGTDSNLTERLRIDSTGIVRVGNNSSFSPHAAADDLVVGATSGSNGMTILTGAATGSIFFNDGSGNEGVLQYVHSGTEHMRIKSEGYIKLDAGGNNHGGGVYSREKTCTTSGTNVFKFGLTHGALAGTLYAIGSNSGNSVSKVYAFAGHFGSNDLQKIADSGSYSGNNFTVTCSTSTSNHTFTVTTQGQNVEVSLTMHLGSPNQNVTYTEL